MQPLASVPARALAHIDCVLLDIDDTLTTDGRLTADAYAALEQLHQERFTVVPITGRPAGWCDHIARMWPVSGVVGENGAFWMRYDAAAKKLAKRFVASDAERAANRLRLAEIGKRIVSEVPGSALASDQLYRETDVAIDFCEDVMPLTTEDVDRIVALMRSEGMTAKISSIHVNGWFGSYDKLAMTRIFFDEGLHRNLDETRDRCVFVGDSPNDAPMFAYFPLSIGVANIAQFIDRVSTPPAYTTTSECGAGFVEVAERLLSIRKSA
ncbi:MAG TPA: HAD-IIB family hydrolase [Casimicrobiaceae bacterium]|nr:HAD-IIB family hydrolase [Casimicrobiaceae bacterium]